jgi:cellulose synthase/poly-beta-1,6-N-acetylglucosamine synthase-like glycosyltransferase
VEQTGRSEAGSFINFNGTGGVWRKSCVIDAGGWSADTLTEDLDLSYRAQMKGWKFKYLEDVVSPAELPVLMPAVKNQQYRWNKGAAETAVKNLGRVLGMPFKTTRKVHAIMHLLNSAIFIPLIIAALLSIPVLFLKQKYPEMSTFFHIGSVFLLGFLSIGLFYWTSTVSLHKIKHGRYFLKHFPLFLSMSMGLSLHNSLAVIEGLIGRKTGFIRTPKFNILKKGDPWKRNVYFRPSLTWMIVAEGFLGLYFLFGIAYGIMVNDYGLLLFHLFLSFGFLSVCIYSIMPLKNAQA